MTKVQKGHLRSVKRYQIPVLVWSKSNSFLPLVKYQRIRMYQNSSRTVQKKCHKSSTRYVRTSCHVFATRWRSSFWMSINCRIFSYRNFTNGFCMDYHVSICRSKVCTCYLLIFLNHQIMSINILMA